MTHPIPNFGKTLDTEEGSVYHLIVPKRFGKLKRSVSFQERGLSGDNDIAILGLDGLPWGEHSDPSLATVHQPVYQIARQITRMLIQLIQDEKPEPMQALLEPTLIVRDSTRPNSQVKS